MALSIVFEVPALLVLLLMLLETLPFVAFSLAVSKEDEDDDLTLMLPCLKLLLSSLLLRRMLVVEVIVAVDVADEVAVEVGPLSEDAGDGLDTGADVGVVARTDLSDERLPVSKLDSETLRSLDACSEGPGSGVDDLL